MSDHGDLHNFGQYVRAVKRASGISFQKPRTVYWEWLFFGHSSPLAPFFQIKDDQHKLSPADCLFNLNVEFADSRSGGYSERVLPSESASIERDHIYSLGVLLSYCYVFGIRDLHRYNVIKTKSHLQVIDAEVVLVDLLLPNETLLLPFKDIGPELAGCSLIDLEKIPTPSESTLILQGYCDTFRNFRTHLNEIQCVFQNRKDEMSSIPVRHIMRDTKDYRQWKTNKPVIPYSSSEIEQLARGDIPYFFKFIDDPKLYQYTDVSGSFKDVPVPSEFEKAVARDCTSFSILLERNRIERLLPTGLLFLARRLLSSDFIGKVEVSGITITQSAQKISVIIDNQEYQALRS